MPSANRIPTYRLHKPTGQAWLILNGRHYYLGTFNSPASREKYARLIAEHFSKPTVSQSGEDGFPLLSMNEAIVWYMRFAQDYFVKNGKPTGEVTDISCALGPLRTLYGSIAARGFGPRSLKAVRQYMIDNQDLCRGVINGRINRVRRMFKWLVSEELIPATVHQALCTVAGLRFDRSEARESRPIGPVADEVVDATLRFLPPVVADMVRIQRLTGMRPDDVVLMRPSDIVRQGEIWIYEPADHKMRHFGHRHLIPIGPRTQKLLEKYLKCAQDQYIFSPLAAIRWRLEQEHLYPKRRKTPVYLCEQRRLEKQKRENQCRQRRRPRGKRYDTGSYRRAIRYAITRARCSGVEIIHWHPNQLRHSRGTEVRRQFGLEGAQVTLGHANADVTQIYAERNLDLAKHIAKMTG